LIIARIAFWRGSLSRSGAIGALIISTLTFGFGGRMWGFLLVLFFVTSSALSRFREADEHKAAQAFEKGSRRDLGQWGRGRGACCVSYAAETEDNFTGGGRGFITPKAQPAYCSHQNIL
jgi:uncharacterized membrane protein